MLLYIYYAEVLAINFLTTIIMGKYFFAMMEAIVYGLTEHQNLYKEHIYQKKISTKKIITLYLYVDMHNTQLA